MKTRNIGELTVSAIGLGCFGMSQGYGAADPVESERTLHRALDIGINFMDTANAYGEGHNEELIGRVLNARRDEIVLATKFGMTISHDGKHAIDGHPDEVVDHCDESLKRLRTDVIDLYYLHRLDPKVAVEDTVGAMSNLVEAGKVRYLGLSEVSAATLRRAHAVHPITAVQSEYSLWARDPQAQVLPACRDLSVGFVAFSPLGRAILTGTIADEGSITGKQDPRLHMPRFQGDNLAQNLSLVERFAEIASSKGCSRAQLALAWLLAQGSDIVPIPGTKRVQYLEENAAATEIVLSASEVDQIEALFSADNIAGERYSPAGMKILDRS